MATEAPERRQWHDFDEDGDELAGSFLEAGSGFTAMGERPFVVLKLGDGTERTLWLHQEVLRKSFSREVHRRPSKQIEVGERIIVRRLGERESANGRTYMNYSVDFLDGPQPSQADIFGSSDRPEPEPSPAPAESGSDEDIPF